MPDDNDDNHSKETNNKYNIMNNDIDVTTDNVIRMKIIGDSGDGAPLEHARAPSIAI